MDAVGEIFRYIIGCRWNDNIAATLGKTPILSLITHPKNLAIGRIRLPGTKNGTISLPKTVKLDDLSGMFL